MTWTPAAEQFVRENYARLSARDIAMHLGPWCSKSAVVGKARRLGLDVISRADRAARSRMARMISPVQRRQPEPTPRSRAAKRERPISAVTPPGVAYATFISRSRPDDSKRAVDAAAKRAAGKQVRWCAWRPCDCIAEPGRMFCHEHERRAEELRA